MKNIRNSNMPRRAIGFMVLALCASIFSAPAWAQPVIIRRPGPYHYGPHYPHYPYYPHRRPSDFEKTLAVIGTVGTIAAIAGSRNSSYYRPYYPYNPPTVVVRTPPSPIVVERPVVVEKQVVIERQVPVIAPQVSYSPKLGASFRIENMQIPGYKFTAARLMSDPIASSPLHGIGLKKGDVITRLNDSPADTLSELERHERNTLIRYIRTGTTKVLLANIYIPPSNDIQSSETHYAP